MSTAALSELLDAAGLHTRGTDVAHEVSLWDEHERFQRGCRLLNQLGPGHYVSTAVRVLD